MQIDTSAWHLQVPVEITVSETWPYWCKVRYLENNAEVTMFAQDLPNYLKVLSTPLW